MEPLFVMVGLFIVGIVAYLFVVYSNKKHKAH